jgi:carboxymethylenebutenolidase
VVTTSDASPTTISLPYFIARPAADHHCPGIVVIHEGNGISTQLLRVCQRLAAEGYLTVAPDLFFRVGGTEAGDYMTLIGSLERERTQTDIAEAAGILRDAGATSVGVTGFCMGGLLTYRTAVTTPGFDAAAGFYGAGIHAELGKPRCPTLLVFGGNDQWIPRADLDAVAAHHPETIVYPDAGHGFMRDGSDDYHESAASDAWKQLLAHFAEHLS